MNSFGKENEELKESKKMKEIKDNNDRIPPYEPPKVEIVSFEEDYLFFSSI